MEVKAEFDDIKQERSLYRPFNCIERMSVGIRVWLVRKDE
jgi:hypothetical protein